MHCAHIAGSERSVCVDRDSAPCESRSRGKFVRSREPAIADDIGDQNRRNFSGSRPWRALVRRSDQHNDRPEPPRLDTADAAEDGETKPSPNDRLGSNWRARSLFQGRPLLAPARLRHATVRVTKPCSAPNFSTRKPRQRNSDFHRTRFTRSTVSMLASTPSSTIRRVSSAMPAAKPANGAPPNSTAPS